MDKDAGSSRECDCGQYSPLGAPFSSGFALMVKGIRHQDSELIPAGNARFSGLGEITVEEHPNAG
jgi:hypothetical protein